MYAVSLITGYAFILRNYQFQSWNTFVYHFTPASIWIFKYEICLKRWIKTIIINKPIQGICGVVVLVKYISFIRTHPFK